jgi:hypothetical protein
MKFVIEKDQCYGRALLYLAQYLQFTKLGKGNNYIEGSMQPEEVLREYKANANETLRKLGKLFPFSFQM